MGFYRRKVFPALAACLWLVFLFLDLTSMASSTWVKFAAICLCALTALLGATTVDGKVVAAALCLTVAADWFLLVLDDHYSVGVTIFTIVQLLYAYRLYLLRGRGVCKWGLVVRLVGLFLLHLVFLSTAALFFVMIFLFREQTTSTLVHFLFAVINAIATALSFLPFFLPLFYFLNLCVNTAEAFALGKAQRTFAWGLLLFICCDICVGAYNMELFTAFTWWGSWLFYLPSQVLIVLSQQEKGGEPL